VAALSDHGITAVYHYTPLHYLPFIARSGALLSAHSRATHGFGDNHARSRSRRHDVSRGFGSYAFLTLHAAPPILLAKLAAGFPHARIAVPVTAVEDTQFSLCRFNVAMTRFLRRDGKPGFPESPSNGRYYGGHQIPIARAEADKNAMLTKHMSAGTMIEVLIDGDLALPDATEVHCFSTQDTAIARRVLSETGRAWRIRSVAAPGAYARRSDYVLAVGGFIARAIADPAWRGTGLEYDNV
jgi:hypothetical protein